MDTRYYISPFLKSHALHLVVGQPRTGKTTYTLQMLMESPSNSSPGAVGSGVLTSPFVGFERAQMPSAWFVDLVRPRKQVLEQIKKLGFGQDDQQARSLRVLTSEQIVEAKPTSNQKDPITFNDIVGRISRETANELPPIIVVDGFPRLLVSPAREIPQATWEYDRLKEIDQTYLQKGGCLIGVGTYGKAGRVSEAAVMSSTLNTFTSSLTEITQVRRDRRKVTVEGQTFAKRSTMCAFNRMGLLEVAAVDNTDANYTKLTKDAQILSVAIDISLEQPGLVFKRDTLIDRARIELGIERATVDRWMRKCRDNGTLKVVDWGTYQLNPPPVLGSIQ